MPVSDKSLAAAAFKVFPAGQTRPFLAIFSFNLAMSSYLLWLGLKYDWVWRHGRGNVFILLGAYWMWATWRHRHTTLDRAIRITDTMFSYRIGDKEHSWEWKKISIFMPGQGIIYQSALIGDHMKTVVIDSVCFKDYYTILHYVSTIRKRVFFGASAGDMDV